MGETLTREHMVSWLAAVEASPWRTVGAPQADLRTALEMARASLDLAEQLSAARRELGEVREVLREVEWSGPVDYVSTARDVTIYRAAGRRLKTPRKETQHSRIPSSACPVCGGVKPLDSIPPYDRYVTPVGHTADCSLAAALGKEQGNE